MNETGIEWVKNPDGSQGYTHNPMSGCENHDNGLCKGGGFPCYAYKLANGRLKPLYLSNVRIAFDDKTMRREDGRSHPALTASKAYSEAQKDPFYPRFWEERLNQIDVDAKARGIFVCDMGDLFGIGVPEEWTRRVLNRCQLAFEHRFYLLTKQPQNLIKFSLPENAWVGVTATNYDMFVEACRILHPLKQQGTTTYISLEPLLSWHRKASVFITGWIQQGVSWLIIGACTGTYWEMSQLAERLYGQDSGLKLDRLLILRLENGKYTLQPRIEWVREIVEAADQAGVKVFLKDNLRPLVWGSKLFENMEFLQHIKPHVIERPLSLRQEMPN